MASIDAILKLKDPNDFGIAMSEWILGTETEFSEMPVAQQTAYCISMLEMEVNNGGFEQFFSNSSGNTALETVNALNAIGAKQCAALVAKAIALFPKGEPPRDWEDRRARLESATDKTRKAWNALDDKFFEYPENLAALLQQYVAANKDQFTSPKKKK